MLCNTSVNGTAKWWNNIKKNSAWYYPHIILLPITQSLMSNAVSFTYMCTCYVLIDLRTLISVNECYKWGRETLPAKQWTRATPWIIHVNNISYSHINFCTFNNYNNCCQWIILYWYIWLTVSSFFFEIISTVVSEDFLISKSCNTMVNTERTNVIGTLVHVHC